MERETMKNTIVCRGAVCWGAGEPLSVEEIEVSPPGEGEIRVRMICASICHSDVLKWKGLLSNLFPRVLGHEGVGVVESVGEGVEELKEGDVVIPFLRGECGECRNCSSGKTNICRKYPVVWNGLMSDQTSRMSARGQKLYTMFNCSTFCEYMVVNANYVVKCPPELPPPHAAILACGFTTGFGLPWKEAGIAEGSAVAVFGLGGVGLGAVAGAFCSGASKIIGVDMNQSKKEKAEVFGMTHFINPAGLGDGESVSAAIMKITGGDGVECSCECSGSPQMLNQAILASTLGGGVTVVAGAEKTEPVPVATVALIGGNRSLVGSSGGGVRPRSDFHEVVAKCMEKEIKLDEMVTHHVVLGDINKAFEMLKQQDCVKVIIYFDGGVYK